MADLLQPYDGKWSRRDATHLLWRAGFGAGEPAIERATADGLAKTVDRLLSPQQESEEFRATERVLHRSALNSGNIGTLKTWWLYRMIHTANPLAEKMTLFWHNHFATSNAKVRDTKKMAAQNALLRGHALGNFGALFRAMARDVAMLVWLDGNANRKRHPNENFAREVMELFSLGVGNYSETDIKEAARAFTGWHVRQNEFWFNRTQHDPGKKSVLGATGEFKGDDILEICLAQNACPRFLAGKLLAAFVGPSPETALVVAVAKRIRHHNYDLTPVLRELLSSRAFFAPASRRAIIKSPAELVAGAHQALSTNAHLANSVQLMSDLGQNLFEPPTVKGWEGGRLWINSATLLQRANFAAELAGGTRYGTYGRKGRDDLGALVELLLATDLSAPTRKDLQAYHRGSRGAGAVQLLMTLPEFQLI